MTFYSKSLATLWDRHPISRFMPSVFFIILSAVITRSSDNLLLHTSVSLALLFTGLYLALYTNRSIARGYVSLERIYRWESPFNFLGICLVYGALSFSLIVAGILVLARGIWVIKCL